MVLSSSPLTENIRIIAGDPMVITHFHNSCLLHTHTVACQCGCKGACSVTDYQTLSIKLQGLLEVKIKEVPNHEIHRA